MLEKTQKLKSRIAVEIVFLEKVYGFQILYLVNKNIESILFLFITIIEGLHQTRDSKANNSNDLFIVRFITRSFKKSDS